MTYPITFANINKTYTEDQFSEWEWTKNWSTYFNDFASESQAILSNAGNQYFGTSASSNTVASSGSKTWVLAEESRTFQVGMPVHISRTSAPTTTYMDGIVTSWTSSTKSLVVTVSGSLGSGTHTDWNISLSGTAGSAGGGGSPGGSNTQIQFNDSSSFGGDSNFVWDNTNKRMQIGSRAAQRELHVSDGSSTTTSTIGSSQLVVESGADAGMQFLSPAANKALIAFGDPGDDHIGGVEYTHVSDAMFFKVNGSNRAKISSAGELSVATTAIGGRLSAAVVAGENLTALRVEQKDTTNNNDGVVFQNTGTGDTLTLDHDGATGYGLVVDSASSDACIKIESQSGKLGWGSSASDYIRSSAGGIYIAPNGNETYRFSNNFMGSTTSGGANLKRLAGSKTNNSIQFFGDVDTGITWSATDTLFIATGGTEAIWIDSSQQVGIGDTSPGNRLSVDNSSNSASDIFTVAIDGDNAGAGDAGGIDFSAMATTDLIFKFPSNTITTAGTVSRQIPVDIGGTTYYLVAYTAGS